MLHAIQVSRCRSVSVASIGHRSHDAPSSSCTVGEGSLIGIQSVVRNGAVIGTGCLVGAAAHRHQTPCFPTAVSSLGLQAKAIRELNGGGAGESLLESGGELRRARYLRTAGLTCKCFRFTGGEKRMSNRRDPDLSRRDFVQGAVSGAALAAVPMGAFAASPAKDADKAAVLAQIPKKMHAANIEAFAGLDRAALDRGGKTGIFRRVPSTWRKLAPKDAGFIGVKPDTDVGQVRGVPARSMPAKTRPWRSTSCMT